MEHQTLLSVQPPPQHCASQPLDQIKVTALSAYQTRIENLSLVLPVNGGDVCFRYVGCRLPWSWVHAELDHRLFHPRRADGIDAEASRHLKRSSAHEAFQPCVDHRDGRASGRRVHREDTRGQCDRAPFSKMILRNSGERHLPHQLATKAQLVVRIGQFGERLERSVSGAGDDRVNALNFVKETPDGRRIVEIDLDLPIAGRPYDFVLVLQERLNYFAAYRTGGSKRLGASKHR